MQQLVSHVSNQVPPFGPWTKIALFLAIPFGLMMGLLGLFASYSWLTKGVPYPPRIAVFDFLTTIDGVTGLVSAKFLWRRRQSAVYLVAAFLFGFCAILVAAAIHGRPSLQGWMSVAMLTVLACPAVRGVQLESRTARALQQCVLDK